MKTAALLLLLFFNYAICSAQQSVAVITSITGKASIEKGGSSIACKKGDKVPANAAISLTTGAEVVLMCAARTPVVLNIRTIRAMNLLSKKYHADTIATNRPAMLIRTDLIDKFCTSGNKPALLAVAGYYGHQFFEEEHERTPVKGGVYGAVTRDRNNCADSSLQAFDTICYVKGTDMALGLQRMATSAPAMVNIYTDEATTEPMLAINAGHNILKLSSLKKLSPGLYLWAIEDAGHTCDRHVLHVIDKMTYDELTANYSNEIAQITDDKASQAYLLGNMLEGAHLLADAWLYYQEAAKLDSRYNKAMKAFKKYYHVIE